MRSSKFDSPYSKSFFDLLIRPKSSHNHLRKMGNFAPDKTRGNRVRFSQESICLVSPLIICENLKTLIVLDIKVL